PLAKLQAYKRRMGWRLGWVSSAPSDFNVDLGASTPEQLGQAIVPPQEGLPPTVAQNAAATGPDAPGSPPHAPAAGPGHRAPPERTAPDRGPERGPDRDRRPRLPLPSAGGERLCAPGRRRLPELWDHLAWGGVPDGLLPDPGPDAQGPRRERRLATLAPPPRRVRQRVTRTEAGVAGAPAASS